MNKGEMMKNPLLALMVPALLFSSGQIWAKNGFYMGMDLGIAVAPGMDVESWDNDVATQCDGFINNDGAGNFLVPPRKDCTQSTRDAFSWIQQFDGGTGLLAGVALGYRLERLRVEGEYFYRGTTYDESIDNIQLLPAGEPFQGGKQDELSYIEAGVDDVLSHNFFANLYYDFRSDSKFTPYVGFGVGFEQISLDYFNRWARNYDFRDIPTFTIDKDIEDISEAERENRELLNQRVAGTTTIGRAKLSDSLFGYQAIAGVDYRVSESVTIGFKFRWANFGEFEGGEEWDQLRSHESAVKPGGARVRYTAMTEDIQFWGVSLNLKYQF